MATNPKSFFSAVEIEEIKQAIQDAEMETIGEIRLHIESVIKNGEEVIDRAADVFYELGLDNTQDKTGVLFYLAIESRKFAILGDSGINEVVPLHYWDSIKQVMEQNFRNGLFKDGLIKGITMAGEMLSGKFPYHRNDINELSDEISFGE